ncbi:MAG: 30S ribosomal protein S21 [Planctomycetaceae bacterium]|nr:30S ribosomal protein S21 [Planctomycetaceae bacterium]MCB9953834.1 30S ribosomal protein S21 [Planctomycetaceae bacterium]
MTVCVVVRDDETLHQAVHRFRLLCRRFGVPHGGYIRMADRNRQKSFYESKGVKRHRQRRIAKGNCRLYSRS